MLRRFTPQPPEAILSSDRSFLIEEKQSLKNCLERINQHSGRPCVVVDEDNTCKGVVSEGDIRRALIAGAGLDSSLSGLIKGFVFVHSSVTEDEAARIMSEKELEILPVLSSTGSFKGLWIWESRPKVSLPVLILAGGKGTRLHPLTISKPKPLIEVAGATLLDRAIEKCLSHGFRNMYLSVNYLKEQVIAHLARSTTGHLVEFLEEQSPLGTAGPVGLLPLSTDESVLVVNADVIHNVDLWQLAQQHREEKEDLTVAVRLHQTTVPFGVVEIEDNRIVAVTEKPTISFPVNMGIYVLGPRARQLVRPGEPLDMPELIELAIAQGLRVGAFLTDDYWLDVGTPESLARAENEADVWRREQE